MCISKSLINVFFHNVLVSNHKGSSFRQTAHLFECHGKDCVQYIAIGVE